MIHCVYVCISYLFNYLLSVMLLSGQSLKRRDQWTQHGRYLALHRALGLTVRQRQMLHCRPARVGNTNGLPSGDLCVMSLQQLTLTFMCLSVEWAAAENFPVGQNVFSFFVYFLSVALLIFMPLSNIVWL